PSALNAILGVLLLLLALAAGRAVLRSRRSVEAARTAGYEANLARTERDMLLARIVDEHDKERTALDLRRGDYETVSLPEGAFVPSESPAEGANERTTLYTYDEKYRIHSWPALTKSVLARAALEVFLDRGQQPRIITSSRVDEVTRRNVTTTYYLTSNGQLLLAVRAGNATYEGEHRWYFVNNEYLAYKERLNPQMQRSGSLDDEPVTRYTYAPDTQHDIVNLHAELDLALRRLELKWAGSPAV
ncbi:MAG TPA: hypothetical protein VEU30_01670, partial [Thermoanaerobaculia bacterium]|nr:hypothetical protein [Thermoanaerobaculia bacterium]